MTPELFVRIAAFLIGLERQAPALGIGPHAALQKFQTALGLPEFLRQDEPAEDVSLREARIEFRHDSHHVSDHVVPLVVQAVFAVILDGAEPRDIGRGRLVP